MNTRKVNRSRCGWLKMLPLIVTSSVLADDVKLLNSDGCDNGSGNIKRSEESSFVHNNTYTDGTHLWGWEDRNDPNDSTDYLVTGLHFLRAILEPTGTLWFPGRKLTLDKGSVYCANNAAGNGVGFADLVIRAGTIKAGGSINIYGKITADGSAYGYPDAVPFESNRWAQDGIGFAAAQGQNFTDYRSGTGITHLYATLLAAQPNNVSIAACQTPLQWHSGKNQHYLSVPDYFYNIGFDGDCSAYFATNNVRAKAMVTVNTADFGGSFVLSNLSQVVVGPDVTKTCVHGGIVARDGWIEVPPGKTLEVGDLDFAFAGVASYVTSDGTNAYLEVAYDPSVPYVDHQIDGNQTKRKNWLHSGSMWISRIYRNTIYLGWNLSSSLAAAPAVLRANAATLRETLVVSDYEGSSLTVGDLTLDGAKLDYSSKSFLVEVTNSLTVLKKAKIVPPDLGGARRKPLLTSVNDEIDPDDFELAEGFNPIRYQLLVEPSESGTTLYLEDCAYTSLGVNEGYVMLTEGEDGSHTMRSLYEAGYWSDGKDPHSDTNYFSGLSYRLIASRNGDYTFPGKILAGRFLRFSGMTDGTLTIKNWRFLCNSTGNPSSIYCDGGSVPYRPAIVGEMTVLPTFDGAFGRIYSNEDDGLDSITFYATLHGWFNAIMEIDYKTYNDEGGARFLGDNSDYYGLFRVLAGSRLTLGGGSMPGTVRLHAADTGLAIEGADGATAEVGTLVTTNLAATSADVVRVNVAATNALCVSSLEINGKLRKIGKGVFGAKMVAANALEAEDGVIDVKEGFLRTYAPGAFDGVPLVFADGSGVSIDLDETDATLRETGFKTMGTMAAAGVFAVKITGDFSDPDACIGRSVALMTVPTAFADSIEGHLKVFKPAKGLGVKVDRKSVGEGQVKFTATIERFGVLIIVR